MTFILKQGLFVIGARCAMCYVALLSGKVREQ